MGHTIQHIAELLLWIVMAASVFYALFFALASHLPRRKHHSPLTTSPSPQSFLILFPAYHEDAVIVHSVETFLKQDYPADRYHVAVISDHMLPATNEQLARLPITLLTPTFEKSSKARAMQYAIRQMEDAGWHFDHLVVLDADNVVAPDFLSRLSAVCHEGHRAIQCHRTAKNSNNDIAVLDGVSEEINNSIFRRGHNRIGLSSALIGSGMCFSYEWFSQHVTQLDSAVEDRELEALLMRQGVYIHYAEDIHVMDEKVSNHENFQRQRLRWMTGQLQTLRLMLPHLPKAIAKGNINYIDKTLQQALIPRSILLVLTALIAIVLTVLGLTHVIHLTACLALRWWGMLAALCLALLIAMPSRMRTVTVIGKALLVPRLAWRMAQNVGRINMKSKEFLHTSHGKDTQ